MALSHTPHETVTIRTRRDGRHIRLAAATIPGVPTELHAPTHRLFARAVAHEVLRRSPTTRRVRIRFPDHSVETMKFRIR